MSEWQIFLTYLPLDKANWAFKASQQLTSPMLLYYSGILRGVPDYHYAFLVTQLLKTPANTSLPSPERLHPEASHDFSMVYQGMTGDRPRELLFRSQIAGSDITAKQVAYFLVETFQKVIDEDSHYLITPKTHRFWAGLMANKLYQLKCRHEVWLAAQSL